MIRIPDKLLPRGLSRASLGHLKSCIGEICGFWAALHPSMNRPDHIGWFFLDDGVLRNFWFDDRSPRFLREIGPSAAALCHDCFAELRYTRKEGTGWISYNLSGVPIEGADGEIETPLDWSAMALRNACASWKRLELKEAKQSRIANRESRCVSLKLVTNQRPQRDC